MLVGNDPPGQLDLDAVIGGERLEERSAAADQRTVARPQADVARRFDDQAGLGDAPRAGDERSSRRIVARRRSVGPLSGDALSPLASSRSPVAASRSLL